MIDKNDAKLVAESLHDVEKAMRAHHKLLWRMAFKYKDQANFSQSDFTTFSGGSDKPPPNNP